MNTLSHNTLSIIASYLSVKEMAIFCTQNKKCNNAAKPALTWIKNFLSECSVFMGMDKKMLSQLSEPHQEIWKALALDFLKNRIQVLSSKITRENTLQNLDMQCKRVKLALILDFAKNCLKINEKTEPSFLLLYSEQMTAQARVLLKRFCLDPKNSEVYKLLEKHGATIQIRQAGDEYARDYEITLTTTNSKIAWTKQTPFL